MRTGNVDLTDGSRPARFLLSTGDVLISRGNGTKSFVGLAALVGVIRDPTIFPDTAFRLRFDRDLARPLWVARIWNSEPVRRQIEQFAKTTAGIWKISQTDLNQINLLLPHPVEQQEIIHRIETAFAWLDRVAAEHANASRLLPRLDQAILAKAFRGELMLPDVDKS